MPVGKRRKQVVIKKKEESEEEDEEEVYEDEYEPEESDDERESEDYEDKKVTSSGGGKRNNKRTTPSRKNNKNKVNFNNKKKTVAKNYAKQKKRTTNTRSLDDDDESIEDSNRKNYSKARKGAAPTGIANQRKKIVKDDNDEDIDDINEDEIESREDSKDEDFYDSESSARDDDESFDGDDAESEEEYRPTRTSPRTKKKLLPKRLVSSPLYRKQINDTNALKQVPFIDENDSDETDADEDSDNIPISQLANRGKRKVARKVASRTRSRKINDGSDSTEERVQDLRSKPRRSPPQGTVSLSYKDASDDEDQEIYPLIRSSRRTRSKKPSEDDEEFVPDEKEDQKEESDDALIASSDDEFSAIGSEDDTDPNVGIVRDGDVGNAYSDESEPENDTSGLKNEHNNNSLEIQPLSIYDSSDDDSRGDQKQEGLSSTPSCLPCCPSTEDAITCEPLPENHVCFFLPDQKSRQCFSLNTLRKTALAKNPMFRSDGQQTFLQPPHFRTPMSDDLLDQIASRFGRNALDIHGAFYNRREANKYIEGEDNMDFFEKLHKYVTNSMGSRDVYACPLCYVAAHKDLKSAMTNDYGKNDDIRKKYSTEFSYDPMAVLGYEDNEAFEIASSFCFSRVVEVKDHLRSDHHVSTSKVGGNDLFARFKVRAPDGLLQRYLRDRSGVGTSRHGMMMQYWFEGNNFSFVLLLSLMSRAETCREILADPDHHEAEDIEVAEKYLKPAFGFFNSFSEEAKELWDIISQPFHKATHEEVEDFIANDDEDEEVDLSGYREFNSQSARDEYEDSKQAAAYYESLDKSATTDDDEESHHAEDTGESEVDEENEGGSSSSDHSEFESSEGDDRWEQNIKRKIQSKRENSRKRRGGRIRSKLASPMKKASKDHQESKNSSQNVGEMSNRSISNHSRVLFDNDDDEIPQLSMSSHSMDNTKSPLAEASSAVKKRLSIRDDDDDD